MYLYNDKPYQHGPAVLEAAGLKDGDPLPQEAISLLPVFPPIDQKTQYHVFEGGVLDKAALTYTLKVVTADVYARVLNDRVVALSPFLPYSEMAVDKLTPAIEEEQRLWFLVPEPLRRHVQIGWFKEGAEFTPPDLHSFKEILTNSAISQAEEARQAIAQPIGPNEIGMWLMTYVNVALYLAGVPTPMWDAALKVETFKTGETVEALRAKHIAKAQEYHLLAALTIGSAREAKGLFSDPNATLESLLETADVLRSDAATALRDPMATINQILASN